MSTLTVIENETLPQALVNEELAVTGAYRTAVHKGQTDGRVSEQWRNRPDDEKFLSLNDLKDFVFKRSQGSRDHLVRPGHIRVNADPMTDGLTIDMEGIEYNMSNWAFSQVCGLVKAPADYLRRIPAQLAGINLQHGLMAYDNANGEMRSFAYKNGHNLLRAMTGVNYGRIHDWEVVQQVQRLAGDGVGETRWKVPGTIQWGTSNGTTVVYNPFVDVTKENTTLYASDRDVYIFLVDDTHPIEVGKLDNGEPDLMFRGFVVWNSEVGAKTFGLAKMMLRGVCQNRCLWGVEGANELRIRHSRLAPDRFAYEGGPMLSAYANSGTAGLIAQVHNAKAAIVAKTDEQAVEFMQKAGLAKVTAERAVAQVLKEEGHRATSIWDMVQGITAVARGYQNQDNRLELEMKAGKFMSKISTN